MLSTNLRRLGATAAVAFAIAAGLAGCGTDGNASTAAGAANTSASDTASATGTAISEVVGPKLSANNATEAELRTIPGVGEKIADEITEYRPYDAETGPAKFRDEMSKYLNADDIEAIIQHLDFEG